MSRDLVHEWLARGRGTDPRPTTPLYAHFADAIEKARGAFQAKCITAIAAAGKTPQNWTANAWLAERLDRDTWGRREQLDVHAHVALTEVRGLLVWVAGLVKNYVPSERRDAELDNFRAIVGELAGGAGPAPPAARAS